MERSVKHPAAFTIIVFSPSALRQCRKAKSPPQPAHIAVPGRRLSSGGISFIDFIDNIFMLNLNSHSCGSRNPAFFWIPVFTGMTEILH
jgi:hypothetical protein